MTSSKLMQKARQFWQKHRPSSRSPGHAPRPRDPLLDHLTQELEAAGLKRAREIRDSVHETARKGWGWIAEGPPMMAISHRAARLVLGRIGYRWEVRRTGEQKIGLWRKRFREPVRGERPRRLVFLPGFGDTPVSWAPVLAMASPAIRGSCDELVLVDLPGFAGGLSSERGFASWERLQQSVFDLLDSLAPDTVWGYSMGSWLAAEYASLCGAGKRPRVSRGPSRILLCNPSGVFSNEADREVWKDKFRQAVEVGFETFRPRLFHREPIWIRMFLKEFSRFISKPEIRDFMGSVRDDHFMDETRLGSIRARVDMLWGEFDGLIGPDTVPAWMSRVRAPARAIVLPGVGHSPHLEKPALTAAALSWLLSDRPLREKAGPLPLWKVFESSSPADPT